MNTFGRPRGGLGVKNGAPGHPSLTRMRDLPNLPSRLEAGNCNHLRWREPCGNWTAAPCIVSYGSLTIAKHSRKLHALNTKTCWHAPAQVRMDTTHVPACYRGQRNRTCRCIAVLPCKLPCKTAWAQTWSGPFIASLWMSMTVLRELLDNCVVHSFLWEPCVTVGNLRKQHDVEGCKGTN